LKARAAGPRIAPPAGRAGLAPAAHGGYSEWMLWVAFSLVQCCGGAESVSAVSKNGRFRVDALALVPHSHGPYPYRYTWSERGPDGRYGESSSFQVTYDSTGHFNMRLFVSPTGNGFLVESSLSKPGLVFFAPSGEKLYTVETVDRSVRLSSDGPLSEDGASLRLIEWKSGAPGQPGAVWRLFLPMGRETAGVKELLRPPKTADLKPHLSGLEDDDPEVREKAAEAIRAMGPPVMEALTREIGRAGSVDARGRMEEILARIRLKTKDHPHPHRNLLLLASALSHPDEAIATVARERLRAILPRGATLEPAWVEKHLDRLSWDEEEKRYR
jgi:hypothetical protein